jgi:hypothetical protein
LLGDAVTLVVQSSAKMDWLKDNWFKLAIWEVVLLTTLVYMLLWIIPIVLCFGLVKMLEDIQNHPESLERIEGQITALKNKLLSRK